MTGTPNNPDHKISACWINQHDMDSPEWAEATEFALKVGQDLGGYRSPEVLDDLGDAFEDYMQAILTELHLRDKQLAHKIITYGPSSYSLSRVRNETCDASIGTPPFGTRECNEQAVADLIVAGYPKSLCALHYSQGLAWNANDKAEEISAIQDQLDGHTSLDTEMQAEEDARETARIESLRAKLYDEPQDHAGEWQVHRQDSDGNTIDIAYFPHKAAARDAFRTWTMLNLELATTRFISSMARVGKMHAEITIDSLTEAQSHIRGEHTNGHLGWVRMELIRD